MTQAAIEVRNVSKKFRMFHERNQSLKSALMRKKVSSHDEFWALRDVSFQVPAGSTFGLIGSNGSGKSTLLKCLAKIYSPDRGEIIARGKVASLLEVGSGFHPELSGRENVFLNGSILGMSKREIESKFDDIVEFSEIGEFIDQPVKNYSSGMYVRLGFSIAIHVDPDILVVDEILAVGDAAFQQKCEQKFLDLQAAGKTVILVSHSLATIKKMCDMAVWLEKGVVRKVGAIDEVIEAYSFSILPVHPEIAAFVDSFPDSRNVIGWPVTGPIHFEENGGGMVQGFSHAAVVWRTSDHKYVVRGQIREAYNARDGVRGELGWPAGDQITAEDGSMIQAFQHGQIEVTSTGRVTINYDASPDSE